MGRAPLSSGCFGKNYNACITLRFGSPIIANIKANVSRRLTLTLEAMSQNGPALLVLKHVQGRRIELWDDTSDCVRSSAALSKISSRHKVGDGGLGSVGDWALRDFGRDRCGANCVGPIESEAFPAPKEGLYCYALRKSTMNPTCDGSDGLRSIPKGSEQRPVEPRAEGTSSAVPCRCPQRKR